VCVCSGCRGQIRGLIVIEPGGLWAAGQGSSGRLGAVEAFGAPG